VYIDSPVGFTLVPSGLYISCFNQISPLPPLSILYHHAPLIFNSLLYSELYYTFILFQYFSSVTFPFSLPPPIVPSDGLTNTILFWLRQLLKTVHRDYDLSTIGAHFYWLFGFLLLLDIMENKAGMYFCFLVFGGIFLVCPYWGLTSGPHVCKAGSLPLETLC
jgi:hypothetical protein